MDINLENWDTQNIIHTSNEVQEEQRSGPLFWKDSVKQYRAKPERGSGKRWEGGQGERRGLMGLSGSGGARKGETIGNVNKKYIK